MDILDITGEEIRKLRDEIGWTRAKLSEITGVPERTIQDIETGISKNPGIYTIKEILKNLPNYRDNRKAELILDVQSSLAALDYSELLTIQSSISDLIDGRTSYSKSTIAD